jgi:signal transduction histidine kinase
MLTSADIEGQLNRSDYICVATDLFTRMSSQLQSLETMNQRMTLAMTTAGHDLRQRLHLLLGTVDLLTSAADRSRTRELAERARSLIFRLAGELEQLATQTGRELQCDKPSACGFEISMVQGQIESDWAGEAALKDLHFTVGHADCWVESDLRLLGVIMNNVVGNAVRHTNQGEVTVSPMIEDGLLVLAVSDTGPGIPDEALRRSLSFSSRLRGFHEGLGLGLSIARKTAEMLGHDLAVSTGPSGGTCVRVYVPINRFADDSSLSALRTT